MDSTRASIVGISNGHGPPLHGIKRKALNGEISSHPQKTAKSSTDAAPASNLPSLLIPINFAIDEQTSEITQIAIAVFSMEQLKVSSFIFQARREWYRMPGYKGYWLGTEMVHNKTQAPFFIPS